MQLKNFLPLTLLAGAEAQSLTEALVSQNASLSSLIGELHPISDRPLPY